MKIVTVEEMRRLEQQADASGNTFAQMMETAGLRAAMVAMDVCEGAVHPAVVLAGPGNNGGDGLVVARHLATAGGSVYVHLAQERDANDPVWQPLQKLGVAYAVGDGPEALQTLRARLDEAALVVDALLGTGARPPVRGAIASILEQLRQSLRARTERRPALLSVTAPGCLEPAPLVVAVDVPSGLDGDTGEVDELTPRADITITMGLPKRGLFHFPGAERVGQLVVADIGLPSAPAEPGEPELLTPDLVRSLLPARPRDGHKGTFGSVLVVAGSANYTGAALLTAGGAARTGCGLVTLAGVGQVLSGADAVVPEATRLYLPGEMGVIEESAVGVLRKEWGRYQAIVLGPGLTTERPAHQFLTRLLEGAGGAARRAIGFVRSGAAAEGQQEPEGHLPPCVFDADALNLLAEERGLLEHLPKDSILTPHPGEMARLLQTDVGQVQADRTGTAMEAARRWQVVVVLKGAFTVVAAPDGMVCLAPFANPALASGGTGDVLAGAVGAMLAQGLKPYDAARVAIFLHGLAGEFAAADMGRSGVVAGDLLTYLPRALSSLMP
ncbi:MAG: NAD(P)H-hydrate dehydratase [Anaerolineae bacterium]|nr:NAD(P)H-hydrate dehydratase [Anaerolineae bacterium]